MLVQLILHKLPYQTKDHMKIIPLVVLIVDRDSSPECYIFTKFMLIVKQYHTSEYVFFFSFSGPTRAGTGPAGTDRTGSENQPGGKKPEIHRLKLLKNILF
jgi:hypothetical protein